jgi:hypothetical protein
MSKNSKSRSQPVSVNFKIEKGVPIPPRRGRKSKYPVASLKDGESFLVPTGSFKKAQSVVSTLYAAAKRVGIKVSVRIMNDGVRVWRVK